MYVFSLCSPLPVCAGVCLRELGFRCPRMTRNERGAAILRHPWEFALCLYLLQYRRIASVMQIDMCVGSVPAPSYRLRYEVR